MTTTKRLVKRVPDTFTDLAPLCPHVSIRPLTDPQTTVVCCSTCGVLHYVRTGVMETITKPGWPLLWEDTPE